MAFLYAFIIRNNALNTTVFTKKTDNRVYLHFKSFSITNLEM